MHYIVLLLKNLFLKLTAIGVLDFIIVVIIFLLPGGAIFLLWQRFKRR